MSEFDSFAFVCHTCDAQVVGSSGSGCSQCELRYCRPCVAAGAVPDYCPVC